ncbi:dynamin family protein [Lapidilactobacillus luobeiensis]|uniref:dynamin family protein n=1 Tax=Lapidilactobacillus luobeiensis TaxID=2950371 RepID=UPI0021C2A037|nr:dynamin family protein [Lapidilactobacillus luobeiensis]
MHKVKLTHNPYRVKTTISSNGNELAVDSKMKNFLNRRFQLWVDQIPELLVGEYNDFDFELDFYGTELDYQDLEVAVHDAVTTNKGKWKFNLTHHQAKAFGEKEKELKKLFKEIKQLPFDELKNPQLEKKFNEALGEKFDVTVVAPMSAGKSTLINALLGKKLMPSKQGACTAKITRIIDNDQDNFEATVYRENSEEEIRPTTNEELAKKLKKLNDDKSVSQIDIFGNIPFVTNADSSLVLTDTPGPDNAGDKSHRKIADRALEESSKTLVLFVMDGVTLNNTSQDEYLRRISEAMKVGGKQSKDRFLFVINKMDGYTQSDEDNSVKDAVVSAQSYLRGHGIDDPNVFPVSARLALDIRKYQSLPYYDDQDLLDDDEQDLRDDIILTSRKMARRKQFYLENYQQVTKQVKEKIANQLAEAEENRDIMKQGLIHSGILGIEGTIEMYVTKYSRPARITSIVQTFEKTLEDSDAKIELEKQLTSNTEKLEKINAEITGLNEKLRSKEANKSYKEKIRKLDLSSKLMGNLRTSRAKFENDLTQFFNDSPEELSEEAAKSAIEKFDITAGRAQTEFRKSARDQLKRDIEDQAQRLLKEYIAHLKSISEKVDFGELNFDLTKLVSSKLADLSDFDKIIDQSVDTRIDTHTETKTRQEERRHTGWARWIFPWRWLVPEYEVTVSYDEEISEEVSYVSRTKLAENLIGQIRIGLKDDSNQVLEFAKQENERIKTFFAEQFDQVDQALAKIMEELAESTRNEAAADKAKKKAEKNRQLLDQINRQLANILEV